MKTLLRSIGKDIQEPVVYESHEITPIPAICTGREKHEWLAGGPNGAIRAPSLRGCRCFWCGKPLKSHPGYPKVIDAETRQKMQQEQRLQQSVLPLMLAD